GDVGLAQDFSGEGLYLLSAVATEIELSAVALLVAAADDIVEHVPPVERAGRPAEQIERRVVASRCQYLGEIFGLGLSQQVDLDADARQHRGDGLTDRLVV